MDTLQAIILGLIQGLTEFLPVSSSGHLEIGKAIMGLETDAPLGFTLLLHGATLLSTLVALWREIWGLGTGFFKFSKSWEFSYVLKIVVSMLPIAVVGLLFKEQLETIFTGNLLLVGSMLLLTSVLLFLAYRLPGLLAAKQSASAPKGGISYPNALLMGVGQALAALPGLSRSGTTISLGLLGGVKQEDAARFSFLMVLPPIIGANLLDLLDPATSLHGIPLASLIAGFLAAFISGYAACRLMLKVVRRKGFLGFSIYCAIVGAIAIIYAL